MQRIGLYGGTFNPIHEGHVEAAKSFLECLELDKLIVMPSNIPPHKKLAVNSPSAQQRLEMARMAFSDVEGIEVSDFEISQQEVSYTYLTVSHLRELYPDAAIMLCVGTDMLETFHQWYRADALAQMCTLVVMRRSSDDFEKILFASERLHASLSARILFLVSDCIDISSTEIRKAYQTHSDMAGKHVPDPVDRYIKKNHLYSGETHDDV